MGNTAKTREKGWFFERFLREKGRDIAVFTLTTLTPSHLPSHSKYKYTTTYRECEGVRVENKIRMRGMFALESKVNYLISLGRKPKERPLMWLTGTSHTTTLRTAGSAKRQGSSVY